MAANLLKAGYAVRGYDLKPEAVETLVQAGGTAAADAEQVVRECGMVLTSLVAHAYLEVADHILVPHARKDQLFIDHGTTPAPDTRRLHAAFAAKGAVAIDAPVSGWWTGARDGTLRVFIGGDEPVVQRCWPLFEVIGESTELHYAGPAGMGQVMKVVQQLCHRLPDAAGMEVMAFGVRTGLSLDQTMKALQVDPAGEDPYARLYRAITQGRSDELSCLFGEWTYYLDEARASGFRMPMLEELYQMCERGKRVNRDEQGREGISVWRELLTAKTKT